MSVFETRMKHSEDSLEALSHMQYDLFCGRNRIARTLISVVMIMLGVMNYSTWWGILVIAYGCYLTTSRYSSANHTAHKLAQQIKSSGMDFPESRFVFEEDAMHIVSLPEEQELNDSLPYCDVSRLGEDTDYFYIFRNEYGGYMLSKSKLGEKSDEFRAFLEKKTGQTFAQPRSPLRRLLAHRRRHEDEPYHL